METISTHEGFIWAVMGMAIDVKFVCLKLSTIMIPITGFYGVIKYFFGFEDEGKINFKKYLFIPLILLVLMMNYSVMMDITSNIGRIMINQLPGSDLTTLELFEHMEHFNKNRTQHEIVKSIMDANVAGQDEKKNFFEKVWEGFKSTNSIVGSAIMKPFRDIGSFLQGSLMKFARIIIIKTRDVALGFMIIVGPISILLSMTPVFRDVFKKWFRIYVGIMLWMVTINIIDALVVNYYQKSGIFNLSYEYKDIETGELRYDTGDAIFSPTKADDEVIMGTVFINGLDEYGMENMFINCVFAMMYMMVPLLTAFFCGEKLAGGFLSMMVERTVSSAVSSFKTVGGALATGGKSLAAGGGGKATKSGLS